MRDLNFLVVFFIFRRQELTLKTNIFLDGIVFHFFNAHGLQKGLTKYALYG